MLSNVYLWCLFTAPGNSHHVKNPDFAHQCNVVHFRFCSCEIPISLVSVQGSLRSFSTIRSLYAQQGLDCLQRNPLWGLDVHGRPIRSVDDHNPVQSRFCQLNCQIQSGCKSLDPPAALWAHRYLWSWTSTGRTLSAGADRKPDSQLNLTQVSEQSHTQMSLKLQWPQNLNLKLSPALSSGL